MSDDNEQVWRFRQITAHQGPLSRNDPRYKGSKYNVLVEWETGETTYEPLDIIAKDDPVTCAAYAKNNDLLNEPGWKRFKQMAKRKTRLIHESKPIQTSPSKAIHQIQIWILGSTRLPGSLRDQQKG